MVDVGDSRTTLKTLSSYLLHFNFLLWLLYFIFIWSFFVVNYLLFYCSFCWTLCSVILDSTSTCTICQIISSRFCIVPDYLFISSFYQPD